MKKGFSLLEVLLALFIICMAAGSFTLFGSYAQKAMARSGSYAQALYVAQNKMEEIRSQAFEQLSTIGPSFDQGQGKIIITHVSADLLEVKVTYDHPYIDLVGLRSRD